MLLLIISILAACEKTEVQIKNGIQSLEVSKIREKNKKNFEKCWLFIINNFIPNRLVETSGDCEWTDNIEYTRRRQTIQTHKTHTHYTAHSHMLSPTFRPTLKAPQTQSYLNYRSKWWWYWKRQWNWEEKSEKENKEKRDAGQW